MRALAVFREQQDVRVIDVAEPPAPTGRQALLRVLEVGICGTDREIAAFEYGDPPTGSDYLILGHEAVAEVLETGPDVTELRVGDLVVPTVRRPCADSGCRTCRIGRQDFCTTGAFTERGIKHAHGYLTELVVEDEQNLVAVPPQLTDVATLIEPLSIAAKAAEQAQAIQQRLPWQPDKARTLVLGAGPIGMLGAIAMTVTRFDTVVYSREPADSPRADKVRELGAVYVSTEQTPIEKINSVIGPIDVIYEAVGVPTVAFTATQALAPNGLLILTGIPALNEPATLPIDRIMKDIVLNNQAIVGTVNAGRSAFELAVQKLEQAMYLIPHSVRSIITNRVPLDAGPEVLKQPHGVKDVLRING
ncbi:MAG: glucose 1-dehydrogenase [Hamadaea sp.]|nr:glucose 1-dehydrogenase [Hamadaea sp.]NUR46999.1 glucose 1-dehydrogenase [Hamadaea sp.]NUT08551.1 glucose 1-dehydrogenase [Hamadaea sp.]